MSKYHYYSKYILAQKQKKYIAQQELNIRKNWLFSLILYTGFLIAGYLVKYGYAVYQDWYSLHIINVPTIYRGLILSICLPVLLAWITYHCAYKKRGTRLIGWISIIGTLGYIAKTIGLIKELISAITTYGFNWSLNILYVFCLSSFVVGTYYLFNSWKLYKLNSAIKEELG